MTLDELVLEIPSWALTISSIVGSGFLAISSFLNPPYGSLLVLPGYVIVALALGATGFQAGVEYQKKQEEMEKPEENKDA
jgi:hypothetical protein